MKYLGDYAEDYATLNFKFSTHKADGTPITLAGTPAISVYKASSTTQSTAGITLAVDFDSVTGLHNVLIDLSADAFYAVANDYSVVITTGTVDSVSVVGTVLATFSIENRFAEVDLTKIAGAAVSTSTAQLGVNAVQISGDGTAADNLETACDGGTYNVGGGAVVAASVTGAVGSVTGAVGSVTGAVGSVTGNVGGNVTGSVGSVVGAVGSVTGAVGSVTADVGITQAGADKVWGTTARTLSSFGSLVADVATAVWGAATRTLSAFGFTVAATVADKAGYSLDAAYDAAKTAAPASTALSTAVWTGTKAGYLDMALSDIPTAAENAAAMAAVSLAAETYAADAAVPTISQALYMILNGLTQFSITGTTLTVYKLDGTTPAMTYTLDSSTAPASRVRAS